MALALLAAPAVAAAAVPRIAVRARAALVLTGERRGVFGSPGTSTAYVLLSR